LRVKPEKVVAFYSRKKFFIKENEMRRIYKDWKVLFFRSFSTGWEKHDDLPSHKHHVFIGLFQKQVVIFRKEIVIFPITLV